MMQKMQASRKLSSESDEGVDMSEITYKKGKSSKCPFYADCVCNSDSDDTNTVISDETCSDINIHNSPNSGSEFEEFPPIKCRQNFFKLNALCMEDYFLAKKIREDSPAWTEDWEDFSSSQDLVTVLKQQNH